MTSRERTKIMWQAMSRWYNQLPDAQSQTSAPKRFETRLQAGLADAASGCHKVKHNTSVCTTVEILGKVEEAFFNWNLHLLM